VSPAPYPRTPPSEALRAELAPLGIHPTVVEAGSFRTQFLTTDSRRQARETISASDTAAAEVRSY
jgi:hypothetical protein